jgi:anti-sigma factor RsiW
MVKKEGGMATVEISCVEVWREISNYLDEEISPEMRERMEAHFKACAHCTAVLDGTRNVVELVGYTKSFRNFRELAHRPMEFVPAETDRRCHGYPCTSTASNSRLCFSARYPHSDLCDESVRHRP